MSLQQSIVRRKRPDQCPLGYSILSREVREKRSLSWKKGGLGWLKVELGVSGEKDAVVLLREKHKKKTQGSISGLR